MLEYDIKAKIPDEHLDHAFGRAHNLGAYAVAGKN
jgi:hypothetical protein